MKKQRRGAAILAAAMMAAGVGSAMAQEVTPATLPVASTMKVEPFHKGDRWGVVGDSITHNGSYHRDVYLFYATRFPDQRFEMFNLGIAGDTALHANGRVDWDILPTHPTVCTISMGMNDVGRGNYAKSAVETKKDARAKSLADYDAQMRILAGKLKDSGARLIFVTTTPVDDTADMSPVKPAGSVNINGGLWQTAELEGEIAKEMGDPLVDFFHPLLQLTKEYQAKDPRFTFVRDDRVHPEAVGHFVMAYTFLKAQGLEGVVSRMDVDAALAKVVASDNCAIDKVAAAEGSVTFSCVERSLPFPIEKEELAALGMVPFVKEFDQEILQVDHLAAGKYQLLIDGKVIGEYVAEQLGAGINLALNEKTPQYQQAAAAMKLNDQRHDLERMDGRLVPWVEWHFARPSGPTDTSILEKAKVAKSANPFVQSQFDGYAATKPRVAEIAKQVDALRDQLWGAVVPKGHEFKVVKVDGEK